MKEQINHPDYYASRGCEVADFIEAFGLNSNSGNVVKYVVRAGNKPGESALDALLKAQVYLARKIVRAGHVQAEVEELLKEVKV